MGERGFTRYGGGKAHRTWAQIGRSGQGCSGDQADFSVWLGPGALEMCHLSVHGRQTDLERKIKLHRGHVEFELPVGLGGKRYVS